MAVSRAKNDLGDIKRILRVHILDTIEVGAGSVVLDEEIAERYATLARETGLETGSPWIWTHWRDIACQLASWFRPLL